jgi:putative ABC transport system substrate-binding protein
MSSPYHCRAVAQPRRPSPACHRPPGATLIGEAVALILAIGLLVAPLPAGAQRPVKVYTIGVLTASATGPNPIYGPILSNALRDSGYHLGGNLVIEARYAAGRIEQLPELAADLVRRKVDLILAFGASESLAAVKATPTIPIVFISPTPIELGLVRSLARPGGNATGLSVDTGPAVVGKILESLKEAVSRLSRVAMLANPQRPELAVWERAAREAARALRVELVMVPVRQEGDLEAALATIARDRPDALVLTADPVVFLHLKRITDFAAQHRLPTGAYFRAVVDEGGLLSYGPNFSDLMRRAVSYIDRILKGAKPADLPIEEPTRFALVINMKTAKALGLTIPPSLLGRADEIIQ